MRAVTIAILAAVAACGRFGFDPFTQQAADAEPSPDAPELGPFAAPVAVAELNTGGDVWNVSLTSDQLELIFMSTRSGGADAYNIWRATRAAVGQPWSSPVVDLELSSTANDSTAIHANDLSIFVTSQRGSGNHDAFLATRSDRAQPWSIPVLVPTLSSSLQEFHVRVDAGGLHAVLSRGQVGTTELYRATRTSTADPWAMPARIDELTSGTNDADPYLHPDGVTLYFSSTRAGGARDLYVAPRPDPDAAFGAPTPIAELNTSSDDRAPWVSSDERVIYFASDRGGGGVFGLYVAQR